LRLTGEQLSEGIADVDALERVERNAGVLDRTESDLAHQVAELPRLALEVAREIGLSTAEEEDRSGHARDASRDRATTPPAWSSPDPLGERLGTGINRHSP
jgi:hypothetical protein